MLKFIISGNPVSSKNSIRSGITKSGRNYTYKTKSIKDYMDNGYRELKCEKVMNGQYSDTEDGLFDGFPISSYIQVSFIFYCIDNRKRDLINLIQAPADLLQQAGIILNDYLIVNLDGSRIAGIDKENPRTEIIINLIKDIT